MTWGYVAMGVGTAVAGYMGANAQEKAGDKAAGASAGALDEQRHEFDLVREDSRVARETGNDALLTLGYLLGVRPAPSEEKMAALQKEYDDAVALKDRSIQAANSMQKSDSGGGGFSLRDVVTGNFPGSPSGIYELGKIRDRAKGDGGGPVGAKAADIGAIDKNIASIKARLDEAKKLQGISTRYAGGIGDFIKSQPGYQFGLDEGMKGVTNLLAANGQGQGGKAIKSALRFGEDYAGSKVDEHLGRLFTLAGYGPVGVNQSATAGQGVANAAMSNAINQGQIAYNNAAANTGALNNAINTGVTLWSYNNSRRTPPPPAGATP